MKASGKLRVALISLALGLAFSLNAGYAFGQDVGADVGGGAGIFRAKNPEAKKKPKTAGTSTKPSGRNSRNTSAGVADKI